MNYFEINLGILETYIQENAQNKVLGIQKYLQKELIKISDILNCEIEIVDDFDVFNPLNINNIYDILQNTEITNVFTCRKYCVKCDFYIILLELSNETNCLLRYSSITESIMNILQIPSSTTRFLYESKKYLLDYELKSAFMILFSSQPSNDDIILFCPSVNELINVLNTQNFNGVLNLLNFWLGNYKKVLDNAKSGQCYEYSGVKLDEYLDFLCVHQIVLVNILVQHCCQLKNHFSEQLFNLINENCISILEILCQLTGSTISNTSSKHAVIEDTKEFITVVCQDVRQLILGSRWNLSNYIEFAANVPIEPLLMKTGETSISIGRDDNLSSCSSDCNPPRSKHSNTIRECLLRGEVSKLLYLAESSQLETTHLSLDQLKSYQNSLIVEYIQQNSGSWADVEEFIMNLGLEPISSLSEIGLSTDDSEIRDTIFRNTNTHHQSETVVHTVAGIKCHIDQLIDNYTIDTNTSKQYPHCVFTKSPNCQDNPKFIMDFVARIQTKDDSLENWTHSHKEFSKTSPGSIQLMQFSLIWIYESSELSETREYIDLCLIDSDLHLHYSDPDQLHLWLEKWQLKNHKALLNYLLESENEELLVKVLKQPKFRYMEELVHSIVEMCLAKEDGHKLHTSRRYVSALRLIYGLKDILAILLSNQSPSLMDQYWSVISWPIGSVYFSCKCCQSVPGTEAMVTKYALTQETLLNYGREEIPLDLYFLIEDLGLPPIELDLSELPYSIHKLVLFCSELPHKKDIRFQLLLSSSTLPLSTSQMSQRQLDELVYCALISRIKLKKEEQLKLDRGKEMSSKLQAVLHHNDYWLSLKQRLLRPSSSRSLTNEEEFYEVNLRDFLQRSGAICLVKNLCENQSSILSFLEQNCNAKSDKRAANIRQSTLNYSYYLKAARPYQAFISICRHYSPNNKLGVVPSKILKQLLNNIYSIAVDYSVVQVEEIAMTTDRPGTLNHSEVVSSCFCLVQLLGCSTEPLRCYLRLLEWISNNSNQNKDNLTNHIVQFQMCFSIESCLRKHARDFILVLLEDMMLQKLKANAFDGLEVVLEKWSQILYFCELTNQNYSSGLLKYYAQSNNWLMFLCCGQIFGYSKDQMKQTTNFFQNSSIRHHMMYVLAKIVDDSPSEGSNTSTNTAVTVPPSQQLRNKPTRNLLVTDGPIESSPMNTDHLPAANATTSKPTAAMPSNEPLVDISKIKQMAKSNLVELLFDCVVDDVTKSDDPHQLVLSADKLLSYCLSLSYPVLAIFAYYSYSATYSSEVNSSEDNSQQFDAAAHRKYIDCLSCMIVSSLTSQIQEKCFSDLNANKTHWSDEQFVQLIVLSIDEYRTSHIVAACISILQPIGKLDTIIPSYFNMIGHLNISANWNPIQASYNLQCFINNCQKWVATNFTVTNRLNRSNNSSIALINNPHFLLWKRIMSSCLSQLFSTTADSKLLRQMLLIALGSYNNCAGLLNGYIKQIFGNIFYEMHLSLIYSSLDILQKIAVYTNEDPCTIRLPIHIKSGEFSNFIEQNIFRTLVSLANSTDKSTIDLLIDQAVGLANDLTKANLPGVYPSDKWKNLANEIKAGDSNKFSLTNQQVDIISLAFSGQKDATIIDENLSLESPQLNLSRCKSNSISLCGTQLKHGHTLSWRQLVIPETWQDEILTIPCNTATSKTEMVNHVQNMLDDRKWIESCSFIIEHKLHVKEAILILLVMKVANNKFDETSISLNAVIKDYKDYSIISNNVADGSIANTKAIANRSASMRRLSHQWKSADIGNSNNSPSPPPGLSNTRYSRPSNAPGPNNACGISNFIVKVNEIINSGHEIVQSVCTLTFVAKRMTESYINLANGDEFDALTKILIGSCQEKIDTANMYLSVVDIDQDQLCQFFADVTMEVLRQTFHTPVRHSTKTSSQPLNPTSIHSTSNTPTSYPTHINTNVRSVVTNKPQSCSPSNQNKTKSGSTSSRLDNVQKIAEYCHFKSDWNCDLPSAHAVGFIGQTRVATNYSNQSNPSVTKASSGPSFKAFYLQDLLNLCLSKNNLARILYRCYTDAINHDLILLSAEEAESYVQLLIICHTYFTESGDTVGISNCLKSAKELSKLLTNNSHFTLMAQLLCRIGRYAEMTYIITTLIEEDQFELLLRKDMDKHGRLVPHVLDFINRYAATDYNKLEMVCHRYNCHFELATTLTKRAVFDLAKLRGFLQEIATANLTNKKLIKPVLSSIITDYLESSKSFIKFGCFKHALDNFRKAQFYRLQYKWLEDPDKTFAQSKSLKACSSFITKVSLPESNFGLGGLRIIDFDADQTLFFLKCISDFYTAYILIDQMKLSSTLTWIELLVIHVIINGDRNYLDNYLYYFNNRIPTTFIQQCLNRMEKLPIKSFNKQSLANLKKMLEHTDDVFLIQRTTDKYQLNK